VANSARLFKLHWLARSRLFLDLRDRTWHRLAWRAPGSGNTSKFKSRPRLPLPCHLPQLSEAGSDRGLRTLQLARDHPLFGISRGHRHELLIVAGGPGRASRARTGHWLVSICLDAGSGRA
jgi:hypothetical protein